MEQQKANDNVLKEESQQVQRKDSCWQRDSVQILVEKFCYNLTDEGRARQAQEILNCYMQVSDLYLYTVDILIKKIYTEK